MALVEALQRKLMAFTLQDLVSSLWSAQEFLDTHLALWGDHPSSQSLSPGDDVLLTSVGPALQEGEGCGRG